MSRTIIFQAAPFCFGPISTTLNIIQHLFRAGHRIIVIDEGPTGDLISGSGLPVEQVSVPVSKGIIPEVKNFLMEADLVVSNTDPVFAAECVKQGIPVAVVDTLFWMWDQLPDEVMGVDLYICQNFSGVQEQLDRLSCPRHFHRTGPLISPQVSSLPNDTRQPLVHVSFGGADCMLVDQEQDPYPSLILGLLEEAAEKALYPNQRVILCCGRRPARTLTPRNGRFSVNTLSKSDYIHSLRRAQGCCLSPGLTGAMEAFEAETPVFFLPPQNYSQVLQLDEYRKAGVAPFGFAWSDVYPDGEIPPYLPEEEAVARVRCLIDRFVTDRDSQNALVERLAGFLGNGMGNCDTSSAKRFRSSLGMEGSAKAAWLIDDWLQTRTSGDF